MRVSVFGLGYVGAVTGACLAEAGHEVIGVDTDEAKVETIGRGESPVVEASLGTLIRAMVAGGRLRATRDAAGAVGASEVALVCVGTPCANGGGPDLSQVVRVAGQIGDALRGRTDYFVVGIRSTVPPGTVGGPVTRELATHSGKRAGDAFGVCFHPEFLREGSSVEDFRDPPLLVVGADDARVADTLARLYPDPPTPLTIMGVEAAEMLKYAANGFHALKVAFGNEVGALCKVLGVDSHEVMDAFCRDRRLNLSAAYLTPGFAYGGSCLPKDLRALVGQAQSHHLDLPVLASIQRSNELHLQRAFELVEGLGLRRVGLLGLSFKRGTDDLRESPLVELAERLLGKGYRVRLCDGHVALARLRGGNRAYIERRLPHLSDLLCDDPAEVVRQAEVVVAGARSAAYAEAIRTHGAHAVVVDLVRLFRDDVPRVAGYHGLCW